jgi:hypothetical protein
MNVQDLKRWHWIAMSIVVGLALGYVWSNVEWDENLPTIGQRDFEEGLVKQFPKQGHLERVTVMPPVEGKYKIVADQVRDIKLVDAQRADVNFRPVAYMADTPYKAAAWRGGEEPYPNVIEYLKNAQTKNAQVSYRYAWWRTPKAVYALWTGASVLLIGGVWPVLVSLMVGAGLGLKRADQGPEYDLERFKGEQAKDAAPTGPTPEQLAHMRELEEELEKKLAAQRAGMPIPEDEIVAAQAAVAKKLDGGPLEAAGIQKQDEEHDYKGEFYPVDRHLPKKKT